MNPVVHLVQYPVSECIHYEVLQGMELQPHNKKNYEQA